MAPRTPKFALRLLERFCPPELFEGVEGDLLEQYEVDAETLGESKARRRLTWNVIKFFRLEILLRNKFAIRLINTIMVGNYFKVAVRNIQKRKLYSLINAFGLSIGIAFCLLIWLFIQDELSFDQMHVNKDNIYRIENRSYNYWDEKIPDEERWNDGAWLQTGLMPAIMEEIPDAEYGTRYSGGSAIVTVGDKVFNEDIDYVDPDFFKMFSFKLINGDAESVLKDKYSLVITPKIAEKYFGDESPIGKTMVLDNEGEQTFTVTGIIEPAPANSSFEFHILLRQENRSYYERQLAQWGNYNVPCFIQLRPGADLSLFSRNLEKLKQSKMAKDIAEWAKEPSIPKGVNPMEYRFTALSDIHFRKEIGWRKVSDPQYSYILGGIAALILLIASINYISLALTTSAARRTEVGIRKVVGALRNQLVYQFGLESLLLSMISLVIGLLMVVLFLPYFNSFTGKEIQLLQSNPLMLAGFGFLLALVVGLVAGSYPSFFLSRFKPAAVLKGRFTTKFQAGFTMPLVVLQFAMSAFLIVSSVIMYQQMKFVSTKDLGFNQHAIVVVANQTNYNNDAERTYVQLKNELEKISSVESVGGTSIAFAQGYNRNGYEIDDVHHSAYVYVVDPNFIPTLDMKLAYGRNFDANIAADSNALIVNEALMRDMGWTDLNEDTYLNWKEDSVGRGQKVIGVVKDFNYRTLESSIEPMLLTMDRQYSGHLMSTLVKISPNDMPGSVEKIESTWRKLFPDKPFAYSFLDEDLAKEYDEYTKRLSIMGASTGFAILISCLGLFGLAGVNAVNRTKEIGIRKVMGADIRSIFILLNRQYVLLSVIAFAIAMPFSWYVMDKWLSGFKFRIPMGWELFAISIVAGLSVALITVSYHAIRAATINPADTLKHE